MIVRFSVAGIPAPKGSWKVWRGRFVPDNAKSAPWERAVGISAQLAMLEREDLISDPVTVAVTFRMPRPKCHYTRLGALKASAPFFHAQKPDVDKLVRNTLDALTGFVFVDDKQVCVVTARKEYADGQKTGADIRIARLSKNTSDIDLFDEKSRTEKCD